MRPDAFPRNRTPERRAPPRAYSPCEANMRTTTPTIQPTGPRTATRTYRIAVIPGDGTGPEVIREGSKVLEAAASSGGFRMEWRPYDLGGARYLKTNDTLPDSVLKELRE